MRTLYIDVYFLINFTVDMLAIYFASMLSGVPSGNTRLIISSALGAIGAVIIVLLPEIPIIKLLLSALVLVLIALVATKSVSLKRRISFGVGFLIFSALLGGAVNFMWGLFDKYLYDALSSSDSASVNKKLLLMAITVLFSIGVFKMIVAFFSNSVSAGKVKIEISFLERACELEAFVDSGNLARDPMDMSPVVFLKAHYAESFLPHELIDLKDPDILERRIRKRIRLIPINKDGRTRIMTGIKPDSVKIIGKNKTEAVNVTIAIDKEGGDYGGFMALMPSAALCNVIK